VELREEIQLEYADLPHSHLHYQGHLQDHHHLAEVDLHHWEEHPQEAQQYERKRREVGHEWRKTESQWQKGEVSKYWLKHSEPGLAQQNELERGFCQVRVYSGKGSGQVRMEMDGGQGQRAGQEISPAGVGDRLDSTTKDNER